MKKNKHIQTFNEHQEKLNISDVSISIEYSIGNKKYKGEFIEITSNDVKINDMVLSIKKCNTTNVRRLGKVIDIDDSNRVHTDSSSGFWFAKYKHISTDDELLKTY